MTDEYETTRPPLTVDEAVTRALLDDLYPESVWALLTLTERGSEDEPDMSMGFILRDGIDAASGLEMAVILLESQGYTVTEPAA